MKSVGFITMRLNEFFRLLERVEGEDLEVYVVK